MIPACRTLRLSCVLTKTFVLFLFSCSSLAQGWAFTNRLAGRNAVVPLRSWSVLHSSASPSADSGGSTKKDKADMMDFISQPMESTVGDVGKSLAAEDDQELIDFVQCLVKAADGRKAEDIVALKVDHISTLASVLIVLSGNSRPQNQAIAAAITKDAEEGFGVRPGGTGVPEGSADSGWILLDYGSVMVHIMTPKSRLYYNIEGQWREKGASLLDISDVLIPNKMEQGESSDGIVAEEDDPFWS